MPYYESVFIARPDISAAQVGTLVESLTAIATENGGSVKKDEYWGLKTLTYKIKKNRKGHYSLLNLDAPPAAIKEMERNMLLNEDILRFMTIRVDELEEEPSIMMRNKGAREERGGRRDDRGPRRDDRPRDAAPASNDSAPASTDAAPAAEAAPAPDSAPAAEAAPAATSEGDEK
ncbi:MAG: 30S ribosomal protein S6 [Rhodospirillaceae bacterium]|nr:30S ribosomal protein S6 [Rhodospirillaceae bacterium]